MEAINNSIQTNSINEWASFEPVAVVQEFLHGLSRADFATGMIFAIGLSLRDTTVNPVNPPAVNIGRAMLAFGTVSACYHYSSFTLASLAAVIRLYDFTFCDNYLNYPILEAAITLIFASLFKELYQSFHVNDPQLCDTVVLLTDYSLKLSIGTMFFYELAILGAFKSLMDGSDKSRFNKERDLARGPIGN